MPDLTDVICPKTTPSYALVIGNNYPKELGKLMSCINDANAIGAALKEVGFIDVVVERNLDATSMRRALRVLRDKATKDSTNE